MIRLFIVDVLSLQNTTCNERPCYEYSWVRSAWSDCSVEAKGCGIGEKRRIVTCERSDGTQVDKIFCLLDGQCHEIIWIKQYIMSVIKEA